LGERLEIVGAPVATLEIEADRPQAQVCVRLNDVAPDGASLRVSYGLLNLSHRDSHETPTPLEPGKRYRVRVQLNDIAHAFPAGHRIRIAVSSSYWPIAWPSPEPVTLTVHAGASELELPVRRARPEDARLSPFAPAEGSPELPITEHRPDHLRETVTYDLVTGITEFRSEDDGGHITLDHIGLERDHRKTEVFRIQDEDPSSAAVAFTSTHIVGRGDWRTKAVTHTEVRVTPSEFVVHARLDAYEGEQRVLSRNWDVRHKRDMV
jgi:hypothetical protein